MPDLCGMIFANIKFVFRISNSWSKAIARTYLQLPLQQWGTSNVYLSSWKVNITENRIVVTFRHGPTEVNITDSDIWFDVNKSDLA